MKGDDVSGQARDSSDLRRQFAKEAGDRGPDASSEVSIAGFRGVLESGLGVVDLADNFVVSGMEFDADHKTRFPDTGPGEPENRASRESNSDFQLSFRATFF